ncbi:F-box/lrr-repeat protein 15-like [Plakobranchus ocellatus]|uniref:F-box/lrr-repeat protein 15-like n=1 Tax=Plakobranchus ocellatus TaxID=259542 RepID=A0AAV4BAB9_9GAST|nr:F-box/lrr-repeat protein 15-like [Plakobranchus ocellatus]
MSGPDNPGELLPLDCNNLGETSSPLDETDYSTGDHMLILDLPWEQVLCSHILPYLNTKDLFRLRSVSRGFQSLVQTHFRLQFHVNTNSLGDHFSPEAFCTLTGDSTCLRTLCLRGAKSWLTSEILLPVIAANSRLEKVDLTNCLALSGAVVYSLGVNCKNLRHLCLENCVWLVLDNFLSFMLEKGKLEFLDLSGCWNLDDDLLVQLVQFTPRLKHLLLANLYGLTDRSIVAIAHSCPNLIHLSIRGCWRVTDGAIKLLSQYCPKLKGLQVKDCRNITEESLISLWSRKVRIDRSPPLSSDRLKLEMEADNPSRIRLVL